MRSLKAIIVLLAVAFQARAEPFDQHSSRLEAAAAMLTSAERTDRRAAAHALADLAGRHGELPPDLERLLWRATGDTDATTAALAAAVLERCRHPREAEPGTDAEIRARADARRLVWSVDVFARSEQPGDRCMRSRTT